MMKRLILIAPILLVAACGDEADEPAATGGEAAGEVLGGTISDDMLPLDELTSTSPPAERTPDSSGGAAATGAETTEAEAPPSAPAPESPPPAPAEDAGEE